MACSRIFSGDIPEVMQNIIENLRDDIKSLYSCILINRICCFLAIPLLWEDPFSVKYQNNLSYHFIDTYFPFLNENDKNKINKIKFHKSDIISSYEPLFHYHTLIKTLDTFRMELHIINWLNTTTSNDQGTSNEKAYFQLITSQDVSNEEFSLIKANKWNKGIQTICTILFNLFVENNVILNKLHITFNAFYNEQLFNSIYELILNNSMFISNIEEFTFRLFNYNKKFNKISQFLSSFPPTIKHIEFFLKYQDNEVKDIITDLIKSQSQLSSIKMRFSYDMLSHSFLDSLKNSSNTLTSLNFGPNIPSELSYDALSHLTQLESLQFKGCNLNSNIFRSLLNIKTPLKIKTLVIENIRFRKIDIIELFVQKIGYHIKNLVFGIENFYNHDHIAENIFDAFINYCEKIQFLHLYNVDFNVIPKLSRMISNFNNTLKFLTIEVNFYHYEHFSYNVSLNDDDNELKISSMILELLCDSLPPNLCYLDLNLVINPNDLKLFFDNCDQIDLKRLLIRNRSSHNLDVTLNVIKEFIKNKNLDYLSYSIRNDSKFRNNLELLFKEIQSFVKMKNYHDLAIKLDHNGNIKFNY